MGLRTAVVPTPFASGGMADAVGACVERVPRITPEDAQPWHRMTTHKTARARRGSIAPCIGEMHGIMRSMEFGPVDPAASTQKWYGAASSGVVPAVLETPKRRKNETKSDRCAASAVRHVRIRR